MNGSSSMANSQPNLLTSNHNEKIKSSNDTTLTSDFINTINKNDKTKQTNNNKKQKSESKKNKKANKNASNNNNSSNLKMTSNQDNKSNTKSNQNTNNVNNSINNSQKTKTVDVAKIQNLNDLMTADLKFVTKTNINDNKRLTYRVIISISKTRKRTSDILNGQKYSLTL